MGFQGNQLNYLDTLFRIGYAVFLIVCQAAPLREISLMTAAISADFDFYTTQILASTIRASMGSPHWYVVS